jgi:regulator of protease activity HflC (stomatin/prohibitin superfamily)
MNEDGQFKTVERAFSPLGGWPMVGLYLILLAANVVLFVLFGLDEEQWWWLVAALPFAVVNVILLIGFFVVNPNESRVLVLFGRYRGTVRGNGFFWTNPFTFRHRVSLRARNHNTDTLKVNDKSGSPIEIAAVIVWVVKDTAHAMFDVDDYEVFVRIQSESAIRLLASRYQYDTPDEEDEEISLRGAREEVSGELQEQLEQRLERAGIEVIEARLSHLAYAPEIAGAMLRRQQADAVIAARKKIVEGAVSMVEMALDDLKRHEVVELDEERKATMVSNLLVVLCSEQSTQPVVNTGSLYT